MKINKYLKPPPSLSSKPKLQIGPRTLTFDCVTVTLPPIIGSVENDPIAKGVHVPSFMASQPIPPNVSPSEVRL